ncbi:hypothetical protein PBY51_021892 [Eleginops maclovinus]|uniref:Uncharacterized protein n=1 Tax=Eleginops maclovinus TaxID=56733 RepID=A0AAN8AHT3_ELEMC|nr:hypothetical protein PBY51_021892 [Eleginops maclovinus]
MDELIGISVWKEPLWAVAACHQRIDQMRDAHNAVNDKLEPIIIFPPLPPGAPTGRLDPGAGTGEGWKLVYATCVWEGECAQSSESNTPGGKKEPTDCSSHHKTITERAFLFFYFHKSKPAINY